ncbi:helix-turn-helix transcriptional regulator [Mucilaginibacter sp.]|jgi:transcriptional regulator with XRE-family HTH domain|uniref:helix-turn-helix domain-containing protein n=1 Tax=Mucilaginibacter sp. TaxID=1882438 RepID=UPI002CF5F652|nr:helix-turn-helix transcriptional regulator [Mucilaginibacter sp.]HTI58994.1 helix-turn-helix transcriptional regulator [Mucilaginibacter sp.]
MNDVGEKIRLQRLTKKYSQEYMAFMLEISQAAYSKIERSETELTLRRVYEIAEILEISPFTLMPPPKHGTAIVLAWRKTMVKLRRFWRNNFKDRLNERKAAYHSSQGH